jgi:hypothetical protein
MPNKKKPNKPSEKKRKRIDWQRAIVVAIGLLFIISFILGSVVTF